MAQLCLGSAARYPLPLSTQQSCVSVVPALVLSLCHLTSIVHSQSAESPQLPNCRISNLSPLLSFCFLNQPCTIIFAHKKIKFIPPILNSHVRLARDRTKNFPATNFAFGDYEDVSKQSFVRSRVMSLSQKSCCVQQLLTCYLRGSSVYNKHCPHHIISAS